MIKKKNKTKQIQAMVGWDRLKWKRKQNTYASSWTWNQET